MDHDIRPSMRIDYNELRKQKFMLFDSDLYYTDNGIDGLIDIIDALENAHPNPGEDNTNIYGPECEKGLGNFHPGTLLCTCCGKPMSTKLALKNLNHELEFVREAAEKALGR